MTEDTRPDAAADEVPADGTASAPAPAPTGQGTLSGDAPGVPDSLSAPGTVEVVAAAEPGSDTDRLARRLVALEEALTLAGDRVAPDVAARARAIGEQVRSRLALGVDHTVVALLGGTGSGKSSVFNAVCGLDFAEVGVKRPTTARTAACVWGAGGEALLDWLEVDADRRIERESALDGDTEAPLRGLVLLDLPDHDSIEPAHQATVDRLLPMADLLVWVVDPQKYADDALHSGYLRRLVGHEGAMLVILNQVDTVPVDQRSALVADLEGLLVADGLAGVTVRSVSARLGDGIAELRDDLAAVVRGRSLAARRGSAEIADAARLVSAQLAPDETTSDALDAAQVAHTLAEAAGLPAIADAVAAVVRGGEDPVPSFVAVQPDTVELARSQWATAATARLPRRWADAVRTSLASAEEIRSAADDALAHVTLVVRRSALAATLFVLGFVTGMAGLALASVGGGLALGEDGRHDALTLVWPVAAGLLVLTVVLVVLGVRARRAAALRRAERVLRDGQVALQGVVEARLSAPTDAVLAEHRRVRELVGRARQD
ncbi:MAG TPA: ABC transporter [Cellulomonas sp.]